MYELKDAVVFITGAAKGIGAAFVRILVEQGVKHVRILDIDEAAGESLQNELNETHDTEKVKFTKCDITNDDELFGAFKDATEQYGYIDLVVNNAGVTNENNSDFIRKEIEVNVTALINGTVKSLELMRQDKGGRGGTVINVSSIAALIKHSPLLFVYAATKSAVLQFSNCIGGFCRIAMRHGFGRGLSYYEAYRRGDSGSTWLINNGKPAKDITLAINKAYAELGQLLTDD